MGQEFSFFFFFNNNNFTLNHFDSLESVVSQVVGMADETAAGNGSRAKIFVITEAVHGGVGVFRFGRRRRWSHHQSGGFVVVRITVAVVTRSARKTKIDGELNIRENPQVRVIDRRQPKLTCHRVAVDKRDSNCPLRLRLKRAVHRCCFRRFHWTTLPCRPEANGTTSFPIGGRYRC